MKHLYLSIRYCLISSFFYSSLNSAQTVSVMAEIQIGELLDKITILQIKNERITDEAKRTNIQTELTSLLDTCQMTLEQSSELETLVKKLKMINEKMWQLEDAIRNKEYAQLFDEEFITLARDIYRTNDERCRIKREINKLTGSRLIEEKSYAPY